MEAFGKAPSGWRRDLKALGEHWPQELLMVRCSGGDGCQPVLLGQYSEGLAQAAPWPSAEGMQAEELVVVQS